MIRRHMRGRSLALRRRTGLGGILVLTKHTVGRRFTAMDLRGGGGGGGVAQRSLALTRRRGGGGANVSHGGRGLADIAH